MSMKKYLIFIMLVFSSIMLVKVYAEEEQTTSAAKCTYKEKNELYKAVTKVTANYEILDLGEGRYSFKISIYNIVDGISVKSKDGALGIKIENDEFLENSDPENEFFMYTMILPSDTDNGTYVFEDPNFETPTTYNFEIKATKDNCDSRTRTIKLVKPMRNTYFDLEDCKYKSTEKITYCQEWINKPFRIAESKILEKIRNTRDSAGKITTTKCENCDVGIRSVAFFELVNQTKLIIAIGLAIGVVIDIFYIYLRIDYIRRSEL